VTDVDQRLRWLLWAALALLVLGFGAFLLKGADEPADPSLEGPPGAAPGAPERTPLPGFEELAITVAPGDGRDLLAWCLLAALTDAQHAQGLMHVTDLQGYPGMAFVYGAPGEHDFWMRNTPMPLSIAYVGEDGHIVSTADMAPCGDSGACPTYPSGGDANLVIEVPQGKLAELGLVDGSTTRVEGTCAPRSASG
jgi:uncharacterized membrane protein (UPF0127 family)